jgi:protein-S-isoprenylcysteine O-methyltransferase Ste14
MAISPARAGRDRAARIFALAGGALFVFSLGWGGYAYLVRFEGPAPAGDSLWRPLAIDALLFTIFAAHHSVFARTPIKRWVDQRVAPRLERSVYVWFASALFLIVCAAWRTVPGEAWRVSGPGAAVLAAMQVAGVVLTLVASRQLDVLSLAGIRQAMGGRGRAPVGLMDTGLYRLVRHPIYFGWVLMVWPAPHMTGTRLAFAAISTIYLAAAIPFEERSLRGEFGPAYDAYASRVRSRMVPFLY